MSWRYELKYLVDGVTQARLDRYMRTRLLPGEFVDERGAYPVLSMYYDGEDLPLYLDKIAGVERREKVRLRTYGWGFDSNAPWFLEAKYKENASIAKRRLFVEPGRIDPLDTASWDALGDEAAPFLRVRELLRAVPAVQVWYQREVLVSPAGDLRVTWDTMVSALWPGERMSRDVLYDPRRIAFGDGYSILEVKAAQTVPSWLVSLIARASLSTEALSKYVQCVNALGLSRKVLTTC